MENKAETKTYDEQVLRAIVAAWPNYNKFERQAISGVVGAKSLEISSITYALVHGRKEEEPVKTEKLNTLLLNLMSDMERRQTSRDAQFKKTTQTLLEYVPYVAGILTCGYIMSLALFAPKNNYDCHY